MAKTKYIICLSIICFFLNKVKGQYSIAGVQGAIYVDIIPDTLLNPPPKSSEQYYIDINQDSFNDIKIYASAYSSPGNTTMSVRVSSLDTFTSFSFGSIDSTNLSSSPPCSGWLTRTILKIYNYGDTIKNASYVSDGYLGFSTWFGLCSAGASSSQWVTSQDLFFGVKYQTMLDTSYGWVKVNVSQSAKALIEEFTLGTPITGISMFDMNQFIAVYPNPTSEMVTIQSSEKIYGIEIINLLGEKVYSKFVSTSSTAVDLSLQQEGVYFIQIKTEEGVVVKKIVVQR